MKENLLVSFSGGETSAFMAQWLWKHKRDEYDMIFVFANTGQENEETLQFVEQCSQFFGFPVVWVEAVVNPEFNRGTKYKIIDFQTADRKGKVFETVIAKYGIPNQNMAVCTRELKERPIRSFIKNYGWKDYFLAIGIRADEADRINAKSRELRIIYPLISKQMIPMTKPMINLWWSQQPFRLNLKGYQGNCKTCWKKGINKLYQIARENEQAFDFFSDMEKKYENYISPGVLARKERGGIPVKLPRRFFREEKSVQDIINESKITPEYKYNDSEVYPIRGLFDDLVGGESCEVFSECGS